MGDARNAFVLVLGAVIAVMLQIVVAPAIEIFSAMPNFIMVYCLLAAIARPLSSGPVLPFVLGLVADFCIGTPVGSSSLALVIVCFAASRAYAALNNDTVFVPLMIIVAASFVVELVMGLFALAFGAAADFGGALVYRVLPCGLYDCVIALILFPLAVRVLAPSSPMGPGTPAQL